MTRPTDGQIEDMREYYEIFSFSLAEISEIVGASVPTVRKIVEEQGWRRPSSQTPRRLRYELTPKRREAILHLVRWRVPYSQIQERLRVSDATITKVKREAGYDVKPTSKRKKHVNKKYLKGRLPAIRERYTAKYFGEAPKANNLRIRHPRPLTGYFGVRIKQVGLAFAATARNEEGECLGTVTLYGTVEDAEMELMELAKLYDAVTESPDGQTGLNFLRDGSINPDLYFFRQKRQKNWRRVWEHICETRPDMEVRDFLRTLDKRSDAKKRAKIILFDRRS